MSVGGPLPGAGVNVTGVLLADDAGAAVAGIGGSGGALYSATGGGFGTGVPPGAWVTVAGTGGDAGALVSAAGDGLGIGGPPSRGTTGAAGPMPPLPEPACFPKVPGMGVTGTPLFAVANRMPAAANSSESFPDGSMSLCFLCMRKLSFSARASSFSTGMT